MATMRAMGVELATGEVLVHFLRCNLRGPQGDLLMFYTRPRMLACQQDQQGIPRDVNVGLQAMEAEGRNLYHRPVASRA